MESESSKETTSRSGLGKNSERPRQPQRYHSNTQPQSQSESQTARFELAEIENLNSKFENLPQMKDTSARIDQVLNDIQKAKQTLKKVRIEGLTNDLDEREVQLSTASEALNHNKTNIEEKLKEVKDTVEQSLEQACTTAQNILSKDENSSKAKELKLQLASVKKQIQDLISQKKQAYGYDKAEDFKKQVSNISSKTELDLKQIITKIEALQRNLDLQQDESVKDCSKEHQNLLDQKVKDMHKIDDIVEITKIPSLESPEENLRTSLEDTISKVTFPDQQEEEDHDSDSEKMELPEALEPNERFLDVKMDTLSDISAEDHIMEENLTLEEIGTSIESYQLEQEVPEITLIHHKQQKIPAQEHPSSIQPSNITPEDENIKPELEENLNDNEDLKYSVGEEETKIQKLARYENKINPNKDFGSKPQTQGVAPNPDLTKKMMSPKMEMSKNSEEQEENHQNKYHLSSEELKNDSSKETQPHHKRSSD